MSTDATAATRADLHALVDALPADFLADAKIALERLTDPSAPGYPDVPEDDEPVTEEDLGAIRRGREAYLRSELIPHNEVMRDLGR